MRRFVAFAFLGALIASLPLTSLRAQGNVVTVEDAWTHATQGFAKTAAVYFTVVNRGFVDDRLVGASSPASDRAETHINFRVGDVIRMRRVISIDIPAGKQTVFSPNRFHVMLTGLKVPLKAGQQVPLTLQFANAGAITVPVTVRN